MPELETAIHVCSFCRKGENEVLYMVVDGDSNVVCSECVAVLIKIDTDFQERHKKCSQQD